MYLALLVAGQQTLSQVFLTLPCGGRLRTLLPRAVGACAPPDRLCRLYTLNLTLQVPTLREAGIQDLRADRAGIAIPDLSEPALVIPNVTAAVATEELPRNAGRNDRRRAYSTAARLPERTRRSAAPVRADRPGQIQRRLGLRLRMYFVEGMEQDREEASFLSGVQASRGTRLR